MKKVVIHRAGSYDELVLEEHPALEPGPGEVVIETSAIGVNYADCIVRMGLYESAKKYVGWPITPGFEFSGRVKKRGHGVDDIEIGAPVFGVSRFDAYATEVRVPRDQVLSKPAGIDDATAHGGGSRRGLARSRRAPRAARAGLGDAGLDHLGAALD